MEGPVHRPGRRRGRARVCVPSEGRSAARFRRPARDVRAGRSSALASSTSRQHDHQSLFAPAVQRGALDRFAGTDALDALDEPRAAPPGGTHPERRARRLGGDERARARELDLLRFQITEIEPPRISTTRRGRHPRGRGDTARPTPSAHRDALSTEASTALEGRASMPWDRGAPRSRTGAVRGATDRLRAVQAELAPTSSASCGSPTRVPPRRSRRLDEVRTRRQLLRELTRKYGDTLDDVRRLRAEARRAAAPSSRATRPGRPRSRRTRRPAGRAQTAAARALSAARRAAARGLADAVTAHLRELAMPAAQLEVLVEPERADRRRRRRRRHASCSPPTRASRPGRWPGPRPAASCRVRCWRCGSCSRRHRRRWCSTRSTPGSVARPAPPSVASSPTSGAVTRCCASRTSRRSRRSPTRRLSSRSKRRGVGRWPARRAVEGDDAGRRALAHARRGRRVRRTPRSHAAELLERAAHRGRARGRPGLMRLAPPARRRRPRRPRIIGTARVDRRTKDLVEAARARRDRGHRPPGPRPRRGRRPGRRAASRRS